MYSKSRLVRVLITIIATVASLSAQESTIPAAVDSATGASTLTFEIARVPVSRFGSYLSISRYDDRVMLRSLHGGSTTPDIFRLQLTRDGKPIGFSESATPALLTLRPIEGGGLVEILVAEPKLLRVRGRGVGIRFASPATTHFLRPFAFRRRASQWVVNSSGQDIKIMVTPVSGNLTVDTSSSGTESQLNVDAEPGNGGSFEIVMEEFTGSWHERAYPQSFDSALASVRNEFASWLASMPAVPEELQPAADLAAYVNWSATVGAEGNFRSPAMLMSKNWMSQVWTWDHCFNAMALVKAQPALAWDQFFAPFMVQNSDGALPDSLTDRTTLWAYTKPPIHGWALRWMLNHGGRLDRYRLGKIYRSLSAWTNWYFRFRDDDGDGLPEYQHGNDSGWDNSTVFLKGVPVESPDLAAFLVLQMDVLSDFARSLGKPAEARRWKLKADQLLGTMIARMWRGDHFVALSEADHDADIESDSLLLYIPLVLGSRLPPDISAKMLTRLREPGRVMTESGLATESTRSKHYVSDGYWLGPVWAPSTMLVVSGLDDLGEPELARDLRKRFCRIVAAGGMAENFDAITGKPLRDPAYTWTSSVFLIFAGELAGKNSRTPSH